MEFGENGSVRPARAGLEQENVAADYTVPAEAKLKRILLGSFVCGVAACILVSLAGLVCLFLGFQTANLFERNAETLFGGRGFATGMSYAVIMSALNWYVGYITVPVAWLVLATSIGRFPKRGIVHAAPYYRWGAIWGAILVGGTVLIFAYLISEGSVAAAIGALVMGSAIGAIAGLGCGAIFRGIVRPAEQVRRIQVEVF